jgi:hypothetical protein
MMTCTLTGAVNAAGGRTGGTLPGLASLAAKK